jgi:hypothetical protein
MRRRMQHRTNWISTDSLPFRRLPKTRRLLLAALTLVLAAPADAQTLPPAPAPLDGNANQLRLSGSLVIQGPAAQPCAYLDRLHPVYGHVDGLTTVNVQSLSGTCFDVSVALPTGMAYVSHAARIKPIGSTDFNSCQEIDPVNGGGTCIPRTYYSGSTIEWRSSSTVAGKDCTAHYAACGGSIQLFEFLAPISACEHVGPSLEYRTARAYFTVPTGSYSYELIINIRPCGGGGGFESN